MENTFEIKCNEALDFIHRLNNGTIQTDYFGNTCIEEFVLMIVDIYFGDEVWEIQRMAYRWLIGEIT